MIIREAKKTEKEFAMRVERAAFGTDEEAMLVEDLLGDPSARPAVSLLAFEGEEAVGHILFTKVRVSPKTDFSAMLLAPLAVVPRAQGKGVGGALIKEGFRVLSELEVVLVFVLGHPGYYPRFGFQPAGALGFNAPYPIPEKDAGAWMVKALRPDILGSYRGKIICADELNKPQYWRE